MNLCLVPWKNDSIQNGGMFFHIGGLNMIFFFWFHCCWLPFSECRMFVPVGSISCIISRSTCFQCEKLFINGVCHTCFDLPLFTNSMSKREYEYVCMTFYVAIYHFVLMELLNSTVDVRPTQKKRNERKKSIIQIRKRKKEKKILIY